MDPKPDQPRENDEPTDRVAPIRVSFNELSCGTGKEVIIEHNGQEYRLRVTRNGGLLLTK